MATAKKFGTFGGVFTPSLLTILGVILYLRLPWIVGQAGLWATLGIIFVAHIISASTGLSVASIATDKKVESGGTYYIISRSLGLPIGGTLGWALFVGLSFSVSLYLIGFAEVFLAYFGFDVTLNNIRIAGVIILLVVTILTFISTSLAIKTQYLILTAMVLSLFSVFLGNHSFAPEAMQTSVLPGSLPWIALFAIFFPAVTGFEAGVSMSGDLRNPKKAIPAGTIGAILVGLITYIGLAFYFSSTVDRQLLVNDTNILFKIAWLPQLVIAGILGATFSSALGSILSAPRILQAVAKDSIAPHFFSKGHGPSNEPRNAILLTFVIALGGILIGELNVIARIVTTFFIITYGFLNITYTVESWASSDFRPSFRIPRFVSIVGALACIIVMIQLDILALIAATVILLGLFLLLRRKQLNLQSGDTWNSVWMSIVKHGLKRLTKHEENNRNWRPNVILMSGGATARPHLIEMGIALVGHQGVFTNFELEETDDAAASENVIERVRVEKLANHPEIITRKYRCTSLYEGIDMISRVYGFSGFEPDTILMGWPKATADPQRMNRLLHALAQRNFNLALLDYDAEKGFGEYSSIDFWWNGEGRELSLAMHLMRFISSKKEWRKAKLRVLALNSDSTLTGRYYSVMRQFIEKYRLNAELKVVMMAAEASAEELIAFESATTHLTLLALPEMDDATSSQLMHRADELSDKLQNCLWIKASGRFEVVEVIPEVYRSEPLPSVEGEEDLLCATLDVSAAGSDAHALTEFAEKEEKALALLNQELFSLLLKEKTALPDALVKKGFDPESWIELIRQQLDDATEVEEELLKRTLTGFLEGLQLNVNALLQQLLLKPGRKDTKAMEIAVNYYLYARRIDSLEKLYTGLLLNDVQYHSSIRQLLVNMQTGSQESVAAELKNVKDRNRLVYKELYARLPEDLRQDIVFLSQMLDNPKLSEMTPGLKKLIQRKGVKSSLLEEAPGRLRKLMSLHWNMTLLDVVCFRAKQDISMRNKLLYADINKLLNDTLYNRLELISRELAGVEMADTLISTDIAILPALDSCFAQLNTDIRDIVERIPELIVVIEDSLPDDLSLENADEVRELEIAARTIADYYVTNELGVQLNTQATQLAKGVQKVAVSVHNIARLTSYHRSQQLTAEDKRVFEDLKVKLDKENERLKQLEKELQLQLNEGVRKAFIRLNAAELVQAARSPVARHLIRHQQHVTQRKLSRWIMDLQQAFVKAVVALFYHQSKGVLWTKRQELAGERDALNPGDVLKHFAELYRPDASLIAQLPYYYVSLFTDDAGASEEFRVVMQEETGRGMKAIQRFREGVQGLIVITGDRGSGKSSLARYLAENQFSKTEFWKVRPPVECNSDLLYFEQQLKDYAGGKGSLERRLDSVQGKRIVLVDDLEIWWERRPGGSKVVERILELVKLYGSQLLFVVTVNRHALRVLEKLTSLNALLNELIYCQPFDAQELKEMITIRHQAGGMSFRLGDIEEDAMSNWNYAQYFNHLFNCSGGNPGLAVQLWLSGFQEVEGTVIQLKRPVREQLKVDGHLTDKEWLTILQFVLHRRLSVKGLALLLHWDTGAASHIVRQLLRKGVLHESSAGVYALEITMELQLITNLKTLTYL